MVDPTANTPEFSVFDLSAALKRTVEDRFGLVRVRGEISNFRGVHSSGHAYFSLKDDKARIDAVIWKGAYSKLRHKPQEGLEVVATGKITTFPGKSSYQIVIESLAPAGVGALMALLDERRRKLAAEGLFDRARNPIPFLPKIIGVVTSPTGAVIRDILHRIRDRCPARVIVWPVRVQGEGAAEEIAAAITGFNALPIGGPAPRPDVLIVARGGGSLEDLWAFNEEIVVRAAAASGIALISAIGHETDTTLIDHAADLRAPTPTGAAELATPLRLDLIEGVAGFARRLAQAQTRLRDQRKNALQALMRVLARPDEILALPRQRLDSSVAALNAQMRAILQCQRVQLNHLALKLSRHSPQAEFLRARARLDGLEHRFLTAHKNVSRERVGRWRAANALLAKALFARAALGAQKTAAERKGLTIFTDRLRASSLRCVHDRRQKFNAHAKLLDNMSYRSVLARGYILARDASLRPLRLAGEAREAQKINLMFADGDVWTTVSSSASEEKILDAKPVQNLSRAQKIKPKKEDQGSLF